MVVPTYSLRFMPQAFQIIFLLYGKYVKWMFELVAFFICIAQVLNWLQFYLYCTSIELIAFFIYIAQVLNWLHCFIYIAQVFNWLHCFIYIAQVLNWLHCFIYIVQELNWLHFLFYIAQVLNWLHCFIYIAQVTYWCPTRYLALAHRHLKWVHDHKKLICLWVVNDLKWAHRKPFWAQICKLY